MSEPHGSGPGDEQVAFACWLDQLRDCAASQRWRNLVWLSGERDWAWNLCAACPPLLEPDAVWCADQAPPGAGHLNAAQANQLLGRETASVVYDAWGGPKERIVPDRAITSSNDARSTPAISRSTGS